MKNISIFKHMTIITDVDVPDKTALIITFDCGCNLNCHMCHYFESRHQMITSTLKKESSKIKKLIKTGTIDCVVLNGGEFLLQTKFKQIITFINAITNNIPIYINTNGTTPDNISDILTTYNNVTFCLDVKVVPGIDKKTINKIIGYKYVPYLYLTQLMQTMDILYNDKTQKHILRTPRYPIMTDIEFDKIKKFIKYYEIKHKQVLKWTINNFY